MSNGKRYDVPAIYVIRLEGELNHDWSDWFQDLEISSQEGGETILRGMVVDQGALHGVLAHVRDLGLTILSVECLAQGSCGETSGS